MGSSLVLSHNVFEDFENLFALRRILQEWAIHHNADPTESKCSTFLARREKDFVTVSESHLQWEVQVESILLYDSF